jgi:hypothetical protein
MQGRPTARDAGRHRHLSAVPIPRPRDGRLLRTPILDELGDALDAAFARQGRRRRRRWLHTRTVRSVAVAAVLLVGLAASAAAATLWVLRGTPIPTPAERDVQPTMRPLTGSEHVLAPNPGGGPPWAIRVGRRQTGLVCSTVGQVVGGRFGIVGFDGGFRELPAGVLDSCGHERPDAAALMGARVFDAPRRADVRTVVNGVAGDQLRSVALRTGDEWHGVRVGAGGAFLTAVRGYPEDSGLRVVLRFADGHRQVHDLGGGPFLTTDPEGGPAWRVSAGSMSGTDGLCVWFSLARPKLNPPVAPQACGHSRGPRDSRQRDPSFFAIQRMRPGDHGRTAFGTWRWRRFPARTAVWGSAQPGVVREVIVHAPDGAHHLRPSVNGSFLVLLGPKVDRARVRVELALKDGRKLSFDRSTNLTVPRKWSR